MLDGTSYEERKLGGDRKTMLQRKISKEKYVIAAIITAAIFFMGFFLGLVVENKRVDVMSDL